MQVDGMKNFHVHHFCINTDEGGGSNKWTNLDNIFAIRNYYFCLNLQTLYVSLVYLCTLVFLQMS